jgi:hypothetical protein
MNPTTNGGKTMSKSDIFGGLGIHPDKATARAYRKAEQTTTTTKDDELNRAHDRLSALLEDEDAGNDDIRDAALTLCCCLVGHAERRRT